MGKGGEERWENRKFFSNSEAFKSAMEEPRRVFFGGNCLHCEFYFFWMGAMELGLWGVRGKGFCFFESGFFKSKGSRPMKKRNRFVRWLRR